MTAPACCAVDWGTSQFRLWSLDRAGAVLGTHRSAAGSFKLKAPGDYAAVLDAALAAVDAAADTPVIVCGMAGSVQGWREAPYLDLPSRLLEIADQAIAAPTDARDVRILPGLAQRDRKAPDVMRGEETLLLGAHVRDGFNGLVCQPGTHSKWIEMAEGVVSRFQTVMTGELFGVLTEHTTLSTYTGGDAFPALMSEDFAAAVAEAYTAPERLTAGLFSVRAGPLLFGADTMDARARLSGLLIGAELAGIRPEGRQVGLLSSGGLRSAYAHAFGVLDIEYIAIDGDAAVRAGLQHAAERIWPDRFVGDAG